jgi:OOP family OmpA-OmpF porin
MSMVRHLIILTSVAALSACSGFKSYQEIEALNEARAVGSPFTQQLAAEYRDFANSEQDAMFDYADALHFARKGLAAAAGEVVLPEPVSDWNLSAANINTLSAARARLMAAFDAGAREIAPREAAMAQGRYDCWIENQEENDRGGSACRQGFEDVMGALEGLVRAPVETAPAPMAAAPVMDDVLSPVAPLAVDASTPMAAKDAVYLVFFDFDRSVVLPAGQNVVGSAVTEIKGRAINTVTVVGHADTAGSPAYNKRLALKRANAVRAALVAAGIEPTMIRVESRGEDELMVPTPDGVREPANRRAAITFE